MARDKPVRQKAAATGDPPSPEVDEPTADGEGDADANETPFAPSATARSIAALTAPTVVPSWPSDAGLPLEASPTPVPSVVPIVPPARAATPEPPVPPAPTAAEVIEVIADDLHEELRVRLAEVETQVVGRVDRVAALVEAQLPDAVAELRKEFEIMRSDLERVLQEATESLAEERRQLRTQIAMTVGAANRWFVRTRDQLYDRLDQIAQLAAEAEAQAELAATVRTAPALRAAPLTPEVIEAPPEPDDAAFEWEVEQDEVDEGETPVAPGRDPAPLEEEPAPVGEEPPAAAGPEGSLTPLAIELTLESAELDALMEPVREDMHELQREVAAMGQVVTALGEQLDRLRQRMPARSRTMRIDATQVDEIVDAVAARLAAARESEAPKTPAVPKKAAPRTTRK